jgi:hypothetical protein
MRAERVTPQSSLHRKGAILKRAVYLKPDGRDKQDLDLQTITPKELSFSSSFVLKANELPTSPNAKVQSGNPYFIGKLHAHRTFATAFVLWLVPIPRESLLIIFYRLGLTRFSIRLVNNTLRMCLAKYTLEKEIGNKEMS